MRAEVWLAAKKAASPDLKRKVRKQRLNLGQTPRTPPIAGAHGGAWVETMLTIQRSTGSRDCQGNTRRDFLQAGFLGLGGLTLPWLLEQKAHAAPDPGFVRDKAVVLIFLGGGASHIETFNPNMDGPEPLAAASPAKCRRPSPASRSAAPSRCLAQHAQQHGHRPLLPPSDRQSRAGHQPRPHRRHRPQRPGQARPQHRRACTPACAAPTMPTPACRPTPCSTASAQRPAVRTRTASASSPARAAGTLGPTFDPFKPVRRRHRPRKHDCSTSRPNASTDRRIAPARTRPHCSRGSDSAAARERLRPVRAASRRPAPGRRRPGLRPLARRSAPRSSATTPACSSAARSIVRAVAARPADAARPPADRGGRRLRHRAERRLGHARRRQQSRHRTPAWTCSARRSTRRCRPSSRTSKHAA